MNSDLNLFHKGDPPGGSVCQNKYKTCVGAHTGGGVPASAPDRDTWQPNTTSNLKHLKPFLVLRLFSPIFLFLTKVLILNLSCSDVDARQTATDTSHLNHPF